jgi:hypothetical protein
MKPMVTPAILTGDVKLQNTAEIQRDLRFISKMTLVNMLKKSRKL